MENFIHIWVLAMHPAAVRDGREHCLKTVHAGGSYNKQKIISLQQVKIG